MTAPAAADRRPFATALAFTLWQEGVREALGDTGYVDHPDDPGGATNWGITQGAFDAWRRSRDEPRADVRELRRPEVDALYERNYWREVRANLVAGAGRPHLALAVFDWGVNGGVVRARRYLQAALGVAIDGEIGPKTLAAVAACDERATVGRFLALRAVHHRVRAAVAVPGYASTDAARGHLEYLRLIPPTPNASQRIFLRNWLARCRANAHATGAPIAPTFAKESSPV
jgi:Glycosyl hydrolase 108